jgi:allantoinase
VERLAGMDEAELVVRGQRVVTPEGVRPCAVHIHAGRITAVTEPDDVPAGADVVDAGDAAVSPGAVDIHVHVNEPGRTDWEGFASATRAAAAGGVTTILDMPLNSVPATTTVAALRAKRDAAAGRCWVDVGFWGGAVPGNAAEVADLHAAGVFGFKCFLVHSGVAEFACLDLDGLHAAAAAVAAVDALLVVHAELPAPIEEATAALADADWRRYATYLASRPPQAEVDAVRAVVDAARATGCRAHILHASAADAVEVVAQAAGGGLAITAETCPHYLILAAEDVVDGQTACKCAPPVRDAANQLRLWNALDAGRIAAVASDHSPSPPELKAGDFAAAWGGIASLQVAPAATWTGARARGYSLDALAGWLATGPARIVGLQRKGAIAPGWDADLVVWHPEQAFTVDPARLEHRHPVSAYDGVQLHGVVETTYLRGRPVWRDGAPVGAPAGRLLERGAA